MPDLNWMISVDDHVIEPPNVWADRVPQRLREVAPHVVRCDDCDYWVYGDKVVPLRKMPGIPSAKNFADDGSWGGFPPGQGDGTKAKNYDEINPAVYDAKARSKVMDEDHVLASLCFPTVVRFAGQEFLETKDHEHRLEFLQAYNDWMIEEWAGGAPGRLIPQIIVPLWDPVAAGAEVRRCAAKGARAFTFPENPAPLGLPTIHRADRYWDPLWDAADETGTVVCQHIGSSSRLLSTSDEANLLVTMSWAAVVNISGALTDWLLNDAFHRFANLKVVLSEGNIGWIPYMVERIGNRYRRARKHRKVSISPDGGEIDFQQVFRDHVYGAVVDDRFGLKVLGDIGFDNVMIETDFPHADSYWPNSLDNALSQVEPLTDEQKYKVFRGTAERLFRFEPATEPLELGDLAGRRQHVLDSIIANPDFDQNGFWRAEQEEFERVLGSRLLGGQMSTKDGLASMTVHN